MLTYVGLLQLLVYHQVDMFFTIGKPNEETRQLLQADKHLKSGLYFVRNEAPKDDQDFPDIPEFT